MDKCTGTYFNFYSCYKKINLSFGGISDETKTIVYYVFIVHLNQLSCAWLPFNCAVIPLELGKLNVSSKKSKITLLRKQKRVNSGVWDRVPKIITGKFIKIHVCNW